MIGFCHDFDAVYRAALEKLSSAELDLVEEIMTYRADRFKEPHQAAWDRLQTALVETGKELGPDSMVSRIWS